MLDNLGKSESTSDNHVCIVPRDVAVLSLFGDISVFFRTQIRDSKEYL